MADFASDDEVKVALEKFADVYLSNLAVREESEKEAFAAYEIALRSAIHKSPHLFKKRFINGYFALTS